MFWLAVLTLVVGAVLAVVQTDVKRMMAYSSINHAGFILLGVQAATARGVSSSLFYLASYTFLVAGSFAVITVMGRRGDGHHQLSDYKGLGRREPLLAFAFTVFLLAQAGTPLTSGFLAKFYVINAAVQARSFWLALVAMISAVISACRPSTSAASAISSCSRRGSRSSPRRRPSRWSRKCRPTAPARRLATDWGSPRDTAVQPRHRRLEDARKARLLQSRRCSRSSA